MITPIVQYTFYSRFISNHTFFKGSQSLEGIINYLREAPLTNILTALLSWFCRKLCFFVKENSVSLSKKILFLCQRNTDGQFLAHNSCHITKIYFCKATVEKMPRKRYLPDIFRYIYKHKSSTI